MWLMLGGACLENWRFESQELMSLEIFSTGHVQVQGNHLRRK